MSRHRLTRDSRGLTTVEYVLVLCLVAVVGYPSWRSLGATLGDRAAAATGTIEGLPSSSAAGGDLQWALLADGRDGTSTAALSGEGRSTTAGLGLSNLATAAATGGLPIRNEVGDDLANAAPSAAEPDGPLTNSDTLASSLGNTARGNLSRTAQMLQDRADAQPGGTIDQIQAGLYDAGAEMLRTVGAVGDTAGTFAAWVVHGRDRWRDSQEMASGAVTAAKRFAEDPMAPVHAAIEHCTGSIRNATSCTVQAAGTAAGAAKVGVAATRAAMEGGAVKVAAVGVARRSRSDDDLPEGDLVPGDHLVTPRAMYRHHGIYVGAGRVVHYARPSKTGRRAPIVRESSIDEFTAGHGYGVRNRNSRKYEHPDAVERAQGRLGEDDYSVVFRNCEHFAEWCVRGQAKSGQTAAGMAALGTVGVVGAAAIARIAADRAAGLPPNEPDANDD